MKGNLNNYLFLNINKMSNYYPSNVIYISYLGLNLHKEFVTAICVHALNIKLISECDTFVNQFELIGEFRSN